MKQDAGVWRLTGMHAPIHLDRPLRPAAMAALGAMLLPVLAVSLPRMVVEGDLETARQTLLAMGRAPGVFLAAGGIQAVGTALVAVVLHYLYRATRARRPETPAIAGVLAIVGPLLYAVVLAVSTVGSACSKKEGGAGAGGGDGDDVFRAGIVRPATLDPAQARTVANGCSDSMNRTDASTSIACSSVGAGTRSTVMAAA